MTRKRPNRSDPEGVGFLSVDASLRLSRGVSFIQFKMASKSRECIALLNSMLITAIVRTWEGVGWGWGGGGGGIRGERGGA